MTLQIMWPPTFNRLRNEIEQAFLRTDGAVASPGGYPAVNLFEDDNNLYVEAEIPGMELEQFELFVNDENQLTIQGERKLSDGRSKARHRQERAFGRFSRMIPLPFTVDANSTKANYINGILKIILPKQPEAKPRRISVVAG